MTTAAPVAAPAPAPKKPFALQLIGPAVPILQEICAHVRSGYVINKDAPFEFYQNGNVNVHLHLGNPDEVAIAQAKETTDHAARQEAAKYLWDVEEAAKRLVEQRERDAIEAKVAAEVAASEKAIAKLKQEAAAALARIAK